MVSRENAKKTISASTCLAAWTPLIDDLSRQLCSDEELSRYLYREKMYAANGVTRIRMFPVWRRYRWEALKITKLQQTFPFLKYLPLRFSRFLTGLIYK